MCAWRVACVSTGLSLAACHCCTVLHGISRLPIALTRSQVAVRGSPFEWLRHRRRLNLVLPWHIVCGVRMACGVRVYGPVSGCVSLLHCAAWHLTAPYCSDS